MEHSDNSNEEPARLWQSETRPLDGGSEPTESGFKVSAFAPRHLDKHRTCCHPDVSSMQRQNNYKKRHANTKRLLDCEVRTMWTTLPEPTDERAARTCDH